MTVDCARMVYGIYLIRTFKRSLFVLILNNQTPIKMCETKGLKYFTFRNKKLNINRGRLKKISILVTLPYFCVNSGIFCQYLLCTVPTYALFASIDSF